jgi:hypothetical protein
MVRKMNSVETIKNESGFDHSMNDNTSSSNFKKSSKTGSINFKKALTLIFSLYLVFVILSQIPFMAETFSYDNVVDNYEAHLSFPSDGKSGHYYVERYDLQKPGKIDLEYVTNSNSLEVQCTNIKVLSIYCREMYEDKSEEVFQVDPELDNNYYKTYFIERDYFYVHVYTEQEIEQLTFVDTPIPYNVTVNGQEWWISGINYTYKNNGIVLTKVPSGHNYVDINFKSNDLNSPIARLNVDKTLICVGETVNFYATGSSDPDGRIISYVWDLGNGVYRGGVSTKYTFNEEGVYKIILTITDDDYLIDRAYEEITVLKRLMSITNTVDKPIATPGSFLNYTYNLDMNINWSNGIKDIEITCQLPEELVYVSATPLPQLIAQTVTWKLGIAFETSELPLIQLQTVITDDVDNNTQIPNFAVLKYSSLDDLEFPQELSNIVYTKVNLDSILAPRIKIPVNDIHLIEDAPPFDLYLSNYEYDFSDTGTDLKWYLTDKNESLYIISGEKSDEDVITITPIPNMYGNSLTTLWLMDSQGYTTNQPLWINITPIDDPPIFSRPPDLVLHYDIPYTFDYEPYLFDIDTPKDMLDLFVKENLDKPNDDTSEPIDNENIEGEHNQINGFKVRYSFPESYVDKQIFVSLIVFDGTNSDSDTIRINITADHTPKLTKQLPDIQLQEGETKKNVFDIDDYFEDPDKDSLFYSIGETHIFININSDHTVDITAPQDWNGVDTVTFRARDPIGAIAEDTIEVTVTPINDPPMFKGIPETFIIHYDADYVFDLTPYINDEDNELNELMLIIEDLHIRTDPVNNLKIIMNYPRSMVGMDVSVVISVSDGSATAEQSFTVKVTENWPPEIKMDVPDITFYEDNILENGIDLNDYFMDKDSNALFFTYGQNFVDILIKPDGRVDFSAEQDWFGIETVTFRATDNTQAFVESVISVTVNPVNDAPVIFELEPRHGVVNELWRIDLTDYISDVDNDISELTIEAQSAKIDINIKGRELLIYSNIPIVENITIYISDGILESTGHLLIEVRDENQKSEKGESNDVLILIILIIIIAIIISISSFTAYSRYVGNYKIEEVFCISNDGLLISHVSSTKTHHRADEQVVSGMLTAIINFTQDAFTEENKSTKAWGIKEIQMNEKNILVERGKFTYLATVFSGRSGKKLYLQSRKSLNNIETVYETQFKNWSGNLNKLIGINSVLERMI